MNNINEDIRNNDLEDIPEVKKYFSRIYNVLSKDVREKLKKLNVPKEKKKKLKKEFAFLSKENQIKYLEELSRIYGQKLDYN